MRAPGDDSPGAGSTGGVPAELLRAGVYVPGTHDTLEEAVLRARGSELGLAAGLRARLAADPALLDEAVGRLARRIRHVAAGSVTVAVPEDVLLAAPVAREAGVPLRGLPGPGTASPPGRPPEKGERCAGVAAVPPPEEDRERVRERLGRSGAVAAGWLALAPADPGEAVGSWCATDPDGGPSTT